MLSLSITFKPPGSVTLTSFTLESLCAEANRRSAALDLQPVNGRTNPQVTGRNVRYYQTLGLLPPVGRADGRAVYGTEHLEAVLAIKAAQAKGTVLKDLPRWAASARAELPPSVIADLSTVLGLTTLGSVSAIDATMHAAFPTSRFALHHRPALELELRAPSHDEGDEAEQVRGLDTHAPELLDGVPIVEPGWSVDLGNGIRLSGTGDAPSNAVLLHVRRALSEDA